MRFINAIALLTTLPFLTNGAPHEGAKSQIGYEVGTFYVNWAMYARQFFVTDLPSEKLTRVNYAFANINKTTGEVFLTDEWADLQFNYPGDVASNGTTLFGNFNQLYKLKQKNRNLRVVLSVGGWSYRENFKTGLATNATRHRFAQSSLQLIADLGLDGIDIDWEYPEDSTDAANFVATVKTCREAFDAYAAENANGYHFEINISAPAGPLRYKVMPIAALDPYVDFWNLMAFDYMGPGFSNLTGHLSNVYPSKSRPATTDFNTAQAIDYYSPRVASPSKIILGLPLYGRSFANTAGLGQTFNGSGSGTWEDGILDYKVLPLNGSKVYTDRKVMASWSYDETKRELVSFDTPEVQVLKTKYVRKEKLGGAWWWESSSDRTDEKSLVTTVYNAFGGEQGVAKKENNLFYPLSKYVNIRGTA